VYVTLEDDSILVHQVVVQKISAVHIVDVDVADYGRSQKHLVGLFSVTACWLRKTSSLLLRSTKWHYPRFT
jgi:hypothetical protein